MTPQIYEELINNKNEWVIFCFDEQEIEDDYIRNNDVPNESKYFNEEWENDRIDILNYYYFWFPLVKDHI